MVIWLIGLSGAGKTVIGREVWRQWKAIRPDVVLLDGDEVREVFRHDRGANAHTVEGRRINAERMTSLCAMLDRQDINVVCSILSIFPDMRAGNRQLFSRYFEVFVDAPMDFLQQQDDKNLYAAARAGELQHVVGVDIPFPVPENADFVVKNMRDQEPAQIATEIMRAADLKRP